MRSLMYVSCILLLGVTSACSDERNAPLAPTTQSELESFAKSLEFRVEIVENMPSYCVAAAPFGLCHNGRLQLHNTGAAFRAHDVELHFSAAHPLLSLQSWDFGLTSGVGDLQHLAPRGSFKGFQAGETIVVSFQAAGCVVASPQLLPRAYLTAPGLDPVIIPNTDTENESDFVVPFTRPEQLLCGTPDSMVPPSALSRLQENTSVTDLGAEAVRTEIVPRPLSLLNRDATLDLGSGVALEAATLSEATLAALRANFVARGVTMSEAGVPVSVRVDDTAPEFGRIPEREAYHLSIDQSGVRVVGSDPAGAFYGVQSVLALLRADAGTAPNLPHVEIPYDAPRYTYRGVHIDVARNFHGAPLVLALLRTMAEYKLNALHLHLADDEGFRLEIPGLPELTELSAQRCHDPSETRCLLPQLGSGPFTDTSGSGYFSREEFISLLRAAAALHIEVVPEFDMPGHSRAAVRAMDLRASRGDSTFRLSDPDDVSQYRSVQFYSDNVINPCLESSYAFVEKIMAEVAAMYAEADVPLRTFHIGADEVPAGAWGASPRCRALYDKTPLVTTREGVLPYFLSRVASLARSHGFGLRTYHEGLRRGDMGDLLDPKTDLGSVTASTNFSTNLQWFDDALAGLTEAGYAVVLSNFDYLFFDHPQEPDPEERGNPWATRFTDTKHVFSFISGNLSANAQLSPVCANGGCSGTTNATPPSKPENVIGLEAALWSELMRTDEQLEYMALPRLLALAERAWHRADWEPKDGMDAAAPIDLPRLAEDWQRFANVLGHNELPKLDRAGLRYRIEVPGGRIVKGRLEANVALPGLRIQYRTLDGEWALYDAREPPALSECELRAVSSNGRAGRSTRCKGR